VQTQRLPMTDAVDRMLAEVDREVRRVSSQVEVSPGEVVLRRHLTASLEALEPFAALYLEAHGDSYKAPEMTAYSRGDHSITVGDLRRAARIFTSRSAPAPRGEPSEVERRRLADLLGMLAENPEMPKWIDDGHASWPTRRILREVIAALRAAPAPPPGKGWRRDETVRGLARRIKADLTPSGLREGGEMCVDALCDAVAAATERALAAPCPGHGSLPAEPSEAAIKAAYVAFGLVPIEDRERLERKMVNALHAAYAAERSTPEGPAPVGPWCVWKVGTSAWWLAKNVGGQVGPLATEAEAVAVRDTLNRPAAPGSPAQEETS
jgi:hypothetical protein